MSAFTIRPIFDKRLLLILTLLITLFADMAFAKINACQPDGMPDVEAVRIIAIAKEHGSDFRRALNAARNRGVFLKTDATYDEVKADPERAFALEKEYAEAWLTTDAWLESRLANGEKMDAIIREISQSRMRKSTNNFYTFELSKHLHSLALNIEAGPTNSPHKFEIRPSIYVFALTFFIKQSGFTIYYSGRPHNPVSVRAYETFALFREEPVSISLRISTDKDHTHIGLSRASFRVREKPLVVLELLLPQYLLGKRSYCLGQFKR